MIYFGNSPLKGFRFLLRVNYVLKNLTLKLLRFCFLFQGLSFYILEKRKGIGDHRTIYLSGGPNLTLPPKISRIIKYKTLRSVILLPFIEFLITCISNFALQA